MKNLCLLLLVLVLLSAKCQEKANTSTNDPAPSATTQSDTTSPVATPPPSSQEPNNPDLLDPTTIEKLTKKDRGWTITKADEAHPNAFNCTFYPDNSIVSFLQEDDNHFQLSGRWEIIPITAKLDVHFLLFAPILEGGKLGNLKPINSRIKFNILELTDSTMVIQNKDYGQYWLESTEQ